MSSDDTPVGFDAELTDTDPIALPSRRSNSPSSISAELSQSSLSDLTPEEARKIQMQALAFVAAQNELDRQRSAKEEALRQAMPVEEPYEPPEYDERYFWTRIPGLATLPALFLLLVVVIGVFIANLQIDITAGERLALIGAVAIFGLSCGLWLARELIKGFGGGIHADQEALEFYEPRIPWLGLLNKMPRYQTGQVVINEYYASFWNFIPGWDSWVLSMDTAAINDEKALHMIKHVRGGDRLVQVISPGLKAKKRKIFKRG